MKSLLISLMAFLCALGVYAAPTGTGTEEDPYVIADGDTYVIPGGATVYSSFTAPSKGTLKLQQSGWSLDLWLEINLFKSSMEKLLSMLN